MRSHIPARVLIPTLACVAALGLAAGPAEAKGGLTISATSVTAHGRPTGQVAVTASGGDDAAGLQRLCVQESTGPGWRTLVCGRIELGNGGTVRTVALRPASRTEYFRAQLWREVRRKNQTTVQILDLTSSTVGVPPLRQPHTNLRSAVSLSSTVKGIVWAAVFRAK